MAKGRKAGVKNTKKKSIRDVAREQSHPGVDGSTRIDKLFVDANKKTTPMRLAHKRRILERILQYIEESGSIVELEARLLLDFSAWCAFHLDARTGEALFLAPWQEEFVEKVFTHKQTKAFCCRRTGKSTATPALVLFYLCRNDHRQVVFFAPTKDQDFCYQSARKMLAGSRTLMDLYVDVKPAMEKFELKNGSGAVSKSVGLQQQGKLARGESGDIIVVDEFQIVPASVLNEVIKPILADAYSEKRMVYIGTPDASVNVDLESDWNRAVAGKIPGCATMQVPWQRGVREGCITMEYVREAYEDSLPDEFTQEYCAEFAKQGGKWYPYNELAACVKTGVEWPTNIVKLGRLIMAIDWAKEQDRTQILIAEVDAATKTQRYVYWKEINPAKGKIGYTEQFEFVKELFWKYKPNMIIPDATSQQDAFIEALTHGENAIPQTFFFKENKDDDKWGYNATGGRNYNMHRLHKKNIFDGRIIVPDDEVFYTKWIKEHNDLLTRPIQGGTAVGFDNPRKGFKDLCIVSAMLSYAVGRVRGPACHYLGSF